MHPLVVPMPGEVAEEDLMRWVTGKQAVKSGRGYTGRTHEGTRGFIRPVGGRAHRRHEGGPRDR